MPDAPATSSSKSKSLGFLSRKIGPVPIWVIAVGLAAAYVWYTKYGPGKSSSTSATAANAAVDPATGETYQQELIESEEEQADSGLQIDIYNQGGQGRWRTPPTGSTVPPSEPAPSGTVTVPDVEGQRANFAIGELESLGLTWHGSPERDPSKEYKVSSQTPGAGKKVAKGSRVDLGFEEIASTLATPAASASDPSAGTDGSTSPAAITSAQQASDAASALGATPAASGSPAAAAPVAAKATPAKAPAKKAAPARKPAPKRTATARPARKAKK